MIEPELSNNEPVRLAALRATRLLDTPLEDRFERLTRMVRKLLDVPIAAVSLVDADRQWFKSIQGLAVCQTSRAVSFCGHTILGIKPLIISNARADDRFKDNPLVTGEPYIVFYAGIPVKASNGRTIASLCVIDHKPRDLSADELKTLEDIASLVESEIRARPDCDIQRNMMMLTSATLGKSRVDELTRLWNEATIEEIRFLFHAEARKSCQSSAVIIARVDGDESMRSSSGAEAADEVIRQVAKRVLASARPIDAVGRSGANEFAVMLAPGTDRAECLAIAQRIRQRIAEKPITLTSGERCVTLSVGLGVNEKPNDNYGSVQLQAAQRAIESAQASGGNCVEYEFVEDDVAPGQIAA